jgi:hypothetical protein
MVLFIFGSSGKRVPQCNNHHSFVQQIAFARRLIPPPALLPGGINRGAANVCVPVSGARFPEEPHFNSYFKRLKMVYAQLPVPAGFISYSSTGLVHVQQKKHDIRGGFKRVQCYCYPTKYGRYNQ